MPDPYPPSPRHSGLLKHEIFFVLRCSLLLLHFDAEVNVILAKELNPKQGVYGMEYDARIWHSLIVLEPDTVVYEVKEGPYVALKPEDFGPWAPSADDPEKAKEYNKMLLEKYYHK